MYRKTTGSFRSARTRVIAGIGILLFSTVSCSILGSEENPPLKIETDKSGYDLALDEAIMVTIRNTSGRTIHYSTCLARRLEILDEGMLIDSIEFPVCRCICPAELHPHDEVDPGISKMPLRDLRQMAGRLRAGEAITYRLHYSLYRDRAWGDRPLPPGQLRSNEFTLLLP